MTGYFYSNVAPMSRLTIRALQDLGYTTDASRADDYVLPRRRLQGSGRRTQDDDATLAITYGDDMLQGPFYRIDSQAKEGHTITLNDAHKQFWAQLLP
jgi:hypothetical protein